MFTVEVRNFDDWRQQARELLRRNLGPDTIAWQSTGQKSLLFGNDVNDFLALSIVHNSPLNIPGRFMDIARNVACFRDESRWPLLYSIAWRLLFEDRNLLSLSVDREISRLLKMQKIIGRDKHKMAAFVRFRRVRCLPAQNPDTMGGDYSDRETCQHQQYYVAWFEPEHLIVPLKAPFFVKRFHNMNWSLLTPDICAHWDQKQLRYTKGVGQPPKVEDELEALWLEYYKNIFNPARLKLQAMQAEMPKKYWANLPEAGLIKELTRSSRQQRDSMINRDFAAPWKKTANSVYLENKQRELRQFHRGEEAREARPANSEDQIFPSKNTRLFR